MKSLVIRLIFALLFFGNCGVIAQNSSYVLEDTLYIVRLTFKPESKKNLSYFSVVAVSDDTVREVRKVEQRIIPEFELESGLKLMSDRVGRDYIIFVDREGNVIESGFWVGEFFLTGIYRLYYKSGALRMTGEILEGSKIGEWKYYNKKGALKRTVCYDKSK